MALLRDIQSKCGRSWATMDGTVRARKDLSRAVLVALMLAGPACKETLDAGKSNTGLLPVDARNPIVLLNDTGRDNWHGEYAMLLSNGGGPPLKGIVVVAPAPWSDLTANATGWQEMVKAARSSGMNVPDPISSVTTTLVRPDNGEIDSTIGTRSEGALFLVEASKRYSLPYRPLVIATGTALTDIANAYFIDRTIVDRVVVVASLGNTSTSGGTMDSPNGNLDPWADTIVASRFKYVQVSAFYDQLTDVPDSRVSELPANDFGKWMAAKQPNLWHWQPASDQVSVIAPGISGYVTAVETVSVAGGIDAGAGDGPDLIADSKAQRWLVTQCDNGASATKHLWKLLSDPKTFGK